MRKLILTILILLPALTWGAIAFTDSLPITTAYYGVPLSGSYTVPASTNLLVAFSQTANNSQDVTWNGTTMSYINFGVPQNFWEKAYYLASPDTGSHTIASASQAQVTPLSLSGVDTTNPILSNNTYQTGGNPISSLSIDYAATAVGNMIIVFFIGNYGSTLTCTYSSGTEWAAVSAPIGFGPTCGFYVVAADTSSHTYTVTPNTSMAADMMLIEVKAAAGGAVSVPLQDDGQWFEVL